MLASDDFWQNCSLTRCSLNFVIPVSQKIHRTLWCFSKGVIELWIFGVPLSIVVWNAFQILLFCMSYAFIDSKSMIECLTLLDQGIKLRLILKLAMTLAQYRTILISNGTVEVISRLLYCWLLKEGPEGNTDCTIARFSIIFFRTFSGYHIELLRFERISDDLFFIVICKTTLGLLNVPRLLPQSCQ